METFQLKSRENYIKLLFLSDVHYGNRFCDEREFKRYIKWAKKQKNLYVITLGDLIEAAIPNHIQGIMWEQVKTPQDQMAFIENQLDGLKVLAMVSGNHEDRIYLRTGIDVTELMADDLGAKYLDSGGYVRIKIGNQSYNIVLLHGSGGSQNPRHQLLKARNIWGNADIIAMGHIHKLYSERVPYYTVEKGRRVIRETILIRTGSFLRYADYAKIKLLSLPDIGSPIVTLYGDVHKIDVRLGI